MPEVQPRWLREQCECYRGEYPHYQSYAEALCKILKAIADLHAPTAIVQARAKTLSSFAEKAVRKIEKYDSPCTQLTDLCAARVITETRGQVEATCRAIRKHFLIDELNSLDVRTRLKTAEFGYASVHYVVQILGDQLVGVPIPAEIGNRKAEIQVRTLLEHAWASIGHDRVYKPNFKIPELWKRELARVAALLEEADGAFGRTIAALDSYKLSYGAYMSREEMKQEMHRLSAILQNEADPQRQLSTALRITRIAKAVGDWERIVSLLKPLVNGRQVDARADAVAEYGHAICRAHRERPSSPEFQEGMEELEEAAALAQNETRNAATAYLAWATSQIAGEELQARERYREALEADPSNPFHLASYLEYELFCGAHLDMITAMRPTLVEAIERCLAYAEAGIELPWAYFTAGKLWLLLGEPQKGLTAYVKAVEFSRKNGAMIPRDTLKSERNFLKRVNFARQLPNEYTRAENVLLLGQYATTADDSALKELSSRAVNNVPLLGPVVIVAGGASREVETDLPKYSALMRIAFDSFKGTIISGGTRSGISGIVGDLAEQWANRPNPPQVIGYLPRSLPSDIVADRRYTELVFTNADTFSVREPLSYWIDLLVSGVKPEDVRLLGIDGGAIAGFEYRLALALGASVGVLQSSGQAASELCTDSDWVAAANLLPLPEDPMSVRAFVNSTLPSHGEPDWDLIGRMIHENFREENRYKNLDPAMQPWDKLREDFKNSNRLQAVGVETILGAVGYKVRKSDEPIGLPDFNGGEVEKMAEMEHGRWVAERLAAGWRYGPSREPAKKISPYLASWRDLPDRVKGYDREAVRKWPGILKKIGLAVVKA